MTKITVDSELCQRCGRCAAACPAVVLEQKDEETPPEVVREILCISCGHCAALCPSGAIAHADFPEESIHAVKQELIPSADQVLEAIRSRRSVRVFHDKPVDRSLVEKVIEGAWLAPTAHNFQSNRYTVVQDRAVLHKIVQLTASFFAKTSKQLRNPVTRTLFGLFARDQVAGVLPMLDEFDLLVEAVRQGKDMVLHGAPCLLLFHADPRVSFADKNAQLALQNATLIAQALGLGSFYTGWVIGACERDSRIPKLLAVPRGQRIYAGLALGHPRLEYKNWLERKPAQVTWL